MVLKASYSDIAGKVAVVTGGSRGIGAAVCEHLAANGASVAVGGRDLAAIDQVVDAIIASGGAAMALPGDVTDPAALTQMRQQVKGRFGTPQIVVALAGGQGDHVATRSMTPDAWHKIVDENLTATFLTAQTFLSGMIEAGSGAFVTVASGAGRVPSRSTAAYAAAKAGVVMLTRHLANEFGPEGVRFNCVSPGAILTPDSPLHHIPDGVRQQVALSHPLGRLGLPDDVASAIVFLASDSASWLTGITLDVAGGRIML